MAGPPMRAAVAAMVFSGAACARKTPSPPPVPPPVSTAEGRQCVQACQAIEATCLAGTNQAPISAVGSTAGGVLLAIIGNAVAQRRGREACEANLAQCYVGCTGATGSATATFPLQWSSCGPRCPDGSAAVWLGLAGSREQYVSIALSMCGSSDSSVSGNWTCSAGSVGCALPGGSLRGALQSGVLTAHSDIPAIAGASCEFVLRPSGGLFLGSYQCTVPNQGAQAGEVAVLPCPQ